jgi:hypothetical protein
MKVGDLVTLNEVHMSHPAYKNKVMYVVKSVHKNGLVEVWTMKGKLTCFNSWALTVLTNEVRNRNIDLG